MEAHLQEWLNLVVRWIHVIVGIAWIGNSFYFNWLNHSLAEPEKPDPEGRIKGENWQIHGGGFYHVQKYATVENRLAPHLHWFMWEAYSTWLSGFALLIIVYYFQANVNLVDPNVADISTGAAVGIGLGSLVVGWLVYDLLCRSPLGRRGGPPFVAVGYVLVVASAWGLTQVLNSRGAFIHVGAMLGTIMAANVFFVIIPSQREVVSAMEEGREPDYALNARAAQRSLHNNYITLPVLFVMISNHYPATYTHEYNWAILAALALIGAVVRHWFNLRHKGHRNVWILPAATVAMLVLAWVTAPSSAGPAGAAKAAEGVDPKSVEAAPFSTVRDIIDERCVECHAEDPESDMYSQPPGGVLLETPKQIEDRVGGIRRMAVLSKAMPLANTTDMTDHERAILGRWIRDGAPVSSEGEGSAEDDADGGDRAEDG